MRTGTTFQTEEGQLVLSSTSRWSELDAAEAIRTAQSLGYTSLIAIEASGRQVNYSIFLQQPGLTGAT